MPCCLGLDLGRNFSYYTVPVAVFACALPNFIATITAGNKVYDPANPRSLSQSVEKSELDKETKERIIRAKAASDNGFETLGLYAAAVAAANQAGLGTCTLNTLTIGYIVSRFGYVFAYIHLGANRKLSPVRSGFWLAGIGAIVTLFVKAANKMSR